MKTITRVDNEQKAASDSPVSYWSNGLAVFVILWCLCYCAFVPQPLEVLRTNFLYILVGFAGAVLGNLTAVGGGLIFIPVLIFLCHVPPVLALKTSIVSQAFGMSSGAIMWSKFTRVRWHIIPWAIPGMLVGSTISSLIVEPNPLLVKGLFGPVSIAMGLLLLFSLLKRRAATANWSHSARAAVIVSSTLGGLITGWVAIGEGELVSAVLMLAFGFEAQAAIAIGVCLLSLNSIYLAVIHSLVLGGVPWSIAAFTVLGCVFGARLAPFCARFIKPVTLKATFAVVAILDGSLFLLQYLLWSHS